MIRNIHMYFYDLFRMYMNFLGVSSEELEGTPDARLIRRYAMSLARSDISTIRFEEIRALLEDVRAISESDARLLEKLLRESFDYAVAIALLDESPCKGSRIIQNKCTTRSSISLFTEEEISRLLKAFSQTYLENAFLMVLVCGLTSNELIQLRIDDYNARDHTLSLTDPHGKERVILLGPVQEKIIQREILRQKHMESLRIDRKQPIIYLFGNYRGQKLKSGVLQSLSRLVGQRSGVPQFTLQRLRRYFIIQSIRNGDNPGDVISYVGLTPISGINYLRIAARKQSIDPVVTVNDINPT